MNWVKKMKNRVVTRKINDKIDEIVAHKNGEIILHLEEMDKGVLHLIIYVGNDGHHFSLNSNSEIKIIKQS